MKNTPPLFVPSSIYRLESLFASYIRKVKLATKNARFKKCYVFGQSETVAIYLIILKMQFLVQFQVKIFACSMMFGIEAISNLSSILLSKTEKGNYWPIQTSVNLSASSWSLGS